MKYETKRPFTGQAGQAKGGKHERGQEARSEEQRAEWKSELVLFCQCFGYQLEDQPVLFVGAP